MTLLFLFAAFPVFANEPTHGIAMHGVPKYGPDATHLEYANPDAPKGGTLTQSASGTFDTLNPYTLKGKASAGLELVYDRLAARVWDEPFTLYGLIAKQMIIPDDRSSITFILNPDAKFHDNTPITTKDVKFTFETLKAHGRPNMRRVYKLVDKVTVENDHSIRFDLGPGHDRETVMILALMPVLPEHVWKNKNFDETTLALPIGSGPYRVTEIDAGRSITYERVTNDWAANHITRNGHHNFDTITFDYYRDDTVALEAFKAHNIDVRREFDASKWASNYDDLPKEITKEAIPHGRPEWVQGFIFNLRREPFDDPMIRKSLSLAFDYDFVNRTLYQNKGKPITSIFPGTSLAATNEPIDIKRRDALKAAAAMLDNAGWVIKGGKRLQKGIDKPLSFQILLQSAQDEKIALTYKKSLNRLGVDVNIRTVDSAQFAGALTTYDYDVVLYRWINSLSPGTEQVIYWGCDAAKHEGGKNYAGICDDQIDIAASAIASAKTRDDLEKATKTLDRLIMNAHIFVPLFTIGEDYWAYWNNITHPKITPLYGSVIETWYEQK